MTFLGNWTRHFDQLQYRHEGLTSDLAVALDTTAPVIPQPELVDLHTEEHPNTSSAFHAGKYSSC